MKMETIIYIKEENVAWITLNRPKVLNAQNATMLSELNNAFELARNDDEVRVIVLTGEGERAFSAGGDIGEFIDWESIDYIKKYEGGKRPYDWIREIPKPG